jgi:uncharacterized RDD family membrane protein YckC
MSQPVGTGGGAPAAAAGNLAEPMKRLLAALIDAGVIIAGAIVIGIVQRILNFIPVLGAIVGLILGLAFLVAVIGYYIYFWSNDTPWTKAGQTIGKMVMNIKVVKQDGSQLSIGDAGLRYIGYIVSALVICLGFIWILIDKDRQGWHDKIAKTMVINA